jgi:regulator of protease activity HflC (stomatin/prohibitin superfamily)
VLVAAIMWGCPQYNVWEQGLRGQAELRRAEQNRQIKVQEATAHEESAKHYARAEIERAKGVSEANKIIGEGLRGNEDYLRYLWIMSLEHVAASPNGSTVVYVPTEANLPIMEANRLKPKP